MKAITRKDYDGVCKMLQNVNIELDEQYVAIETLEKSDGTRRILIKESDDSFEDAAEGLWRMECDHVEECMREGLTCHVVDYAVTFINYDMAFVSDGIHGAFHAMFDHGHVSFEEMMWHELKSDILESFSDNDTDINEKNENGWSVTSAVEEMIALWQTGPCEKAPWEICDDWPFIAEELGDIMTSPCFDEND